MYVYAKGATENRYLESNYDMPITHGIGIR